MWNRTDGFEATMSHPDQNHHESGVGDQTGTKEPRDEDDSYADDTPLTWVLGNHPEVKLVAAILSEHDRPLNKSDLARQAGVIRNNVYDHLSNLLDHRILEEMGQVGQTDIKLYQLSDTKTTELLIELEAMLLKYKYEHEDEPVTATRDPPVDSDITPDSEDPYAEGTPLTWVFGDHPEPKLLAAFLSEPEQQLNVSDWARIAGVSRGAVYNHRESFIEYGIIKHGHKSAGSQHYRLNLESPIVQLLFDLEDHLLRQWYESKEQID